MLKDETLKKIAEVLGIDASDFTTKLKSDKEETLEVPVLFTEEDKNSFGENRFKEGKKAATEILVKDLKAKHSLEFDGKSIDTLLEKFSEKVITDAKIEPTELVKKHKKDADELRLKLQEAEREKQSLINEHSNKLFQNIIDNTIFTEIPDKLFTIPKKSISVLYKAEREFKKEDDGIILYKEGKKLVDKVLSPVSIKDDLAQFCEQYVKKAGMGGGDDVNSGTDGKFTTMSALVEHCQKNGIELMSEKGQKLYLDNKKAVATFDDNS